MESIESLYKSMRDARRALEGNKTFRYHAELTSESTLSVYLWSSDYNETYLSFHFHDIDNEIEQAISAIARIEGFILGYQTAQDKASEVEFGPLVEVKQEPATVEA